jgi:hypothetical protein
MGFFAQAAPTTFVDIRPSGATFADFQEISGSVLDLPFDDGALESVSCLHVIEHIGLGRYGDPIDPSGHRKAAAELARVLPPGGNRYVSTPVGREVTYFHAHRVSDPRAFVALFEGLEVVAVDGIDDTGALLRDVDLDLLADNDYGCGLFWLRRS